MLSGVIFFTIACTAVGLRTSGNPFLEAAKLTSLAQSSALQAHNLALYQRVAGSHAVFSAKSELAQSALNAASAAQAALVSKKLAIKTLEKQLKEAEGVLQAEMAQYEQLQEIAEIFLKAAEDSQKQVETLNGIIDTFKNITVKNDTVDVSDEHIISFGSGFH